MNYEDLEVWFVTGAQLLYGGDAVVAVDAHSTEMVKGLNNSGNLPVKVVYKGTANPDSTRDKFSVIGGDIDWWYQRLNVTAVVMQMKSKYLGTNRTSLAYFVEGKRNIIVKLSELGQDLLSDLGKPMSHDVVKRGVNDLFKLKIIEKVKSSLVFTSSPFLV